LSLSLRRVGGRENPGAWRAIERSPQYSCFDHITGIGRTRQQDFEFMFIFASGGRCDGGAVQGRRRGAATLFRPARVLWIVIAAIALSGCAAAVIADLPAPVGLPEDAPARDDPARPQVYPDVHDTPPASQDRLLTEEEQARLQAELRATRARQAGPSASDR